jgi:uncharacterized lipoprotein YmbA
MTIVVGLLAMSGCLGRSAPPAFYTLSPMEDAPSVTTGGPAVGVGPARLPNYLDRPQIVTVHGSKLDYDELHRWAGGLESELLRALGANLSRMLGTDRVAVYPAEPLFPVAMWIVVDVDRFDGVPGELVTLQARWTLVGQSGDEPLATGKSDIRVSVASGRYEDLVAAHSSAVATLSREIAERIVSLQE